METSAINSIACDGRQEPTKTDSMERIYEPARDRHTELESERELVVDAGIGNR